MIAYGAAPAGSVGEEWRQNVAALEEYGQSLTGEALPGGAGGGRGRRGRAACSERPHAALLSLASEHDARYIVVGGWGESPIRGAILGSTPHKLLHLSDRPVVVVPA